MSYADEFGTRSEPSHFTPAEAREPQVAEQLLRAESVVEQIEGLVGGLRARLDVVSLPSPEKGLDPESPGEILAPLAQRISVLTSRLEYVRGALSTQLHELEV